jgi:hypothetical protein
MAGITTPQVFPTLAPQLVAGDALNKALGNGLLNYQDAVTALAGGGAAGAPGLCIGLNRLSVVATGNDSAVLPMSLPGAQVTVINNGVASAQIFANPVSSLPSGVLDTINGTAGATGVPVGNGKIATFICTALGAWFGPVALA